MSWHTDRAALWPWYGKIIPSEVTDTALTLHFQTYTRAPSLTYSISRDTGVADVGSRPQAAVERSLLFSRSQGMSGHLANGSREPVVTQRRKARDSVIASTDQTETKPARRRPARDGAEFPQD
jgi:hypothetical protein